VRLFSLPLAALFVSAGCSASWQEAAVQAGGPAPGGPAPAAPASAPAVSAPALSTPPADELAALPMLGPYAAPENFCDALKPGTLITLRLVDSSLSFSGVPLRCGFSKKLPAAKAAGPYEEARLFCAYFDSSSDVAERACFLATKTARGYFFSVEARLQDLLESQGHSVYLPQITKPRVAISDLVPGGAPEISLGARVAVEVGCDGCEDGTPIEVFADQELLAICSVGASGSPSCLALESPADRAKPTRLAYEIAPDGALVLKGRALLRSAAPPVKPRELAPGSYRLRFP
jgi:hypothetical protein